MCPLECALINVSGWWMSLGSARARDRHWGYGLALEGVRVVGESGGGGGGEESARAAVAACCDSQSRAC